MKIVSILLIAFFWVSTFSWRYSTSPEKWRYQTCVVNGQEIKVRAGIKGESFTNKCPIGISNTQPF